MLDAKLKTNDNNPVGFMCQRCMTPEIGASPRRHHRDPTFLRFFARGTAARRGA